MKAMGLLFLVIAFSICQGTAFAKVDLVTLPERDSVQLTIYNSADLTLVREGRALTLKKGHNRLQFSWANTLIDPTSLDMSPRKYGDKIDIVGLAFPPRVRNLGVWDVKSQHSGHVPVALTYLTSGLTWRAFYMATLNKDETFMDLKGYVRVTNNSGEDYENAQVRLVVGRINLIDRIVDLARRAHPFGAPGQVRPLAQGESDMAARGMAEAKQEFFRVEKAMKTRPKEIKKEGLSEYFLYTIEATETIPNGWSRRLPSFHAEEVPVVNLYKYDQDRYGDQVVRFLNFKNNKDHKVGDTPIPGGVLKAYRAINDKENLSYEGQSLFKYIPVGEDVELDLGPVTNVIVRPTLMSTKTENYLFDAEGDISGWDEVNEFKVEVKNTRDLPVNVEMMRHIQTSSWDIEKAGDFGDYEKVDLDTVKFTLSLTARETKTFHYTLTTHHGQRAE